MKNVEVSIVSMNELPALAKTILDFAGSSRVFAFYAEMGSGKTTLIKEICRQLGSADNFSSPTYSIVNEYNTAIPGAAAKIYHIDCYRLKNTEEALAIGIEDYLDGRHYCFIEWPGLAEPWLPTDVTKICIRTDENIRNVSIFKG